MSSNAIHTITIDGIIGRNEGEVSAQAVASMLPVDRSTPIEVVIHSEGGSVFEGFAIHDLLASYPGPKKARVASSAFSIASFIPMEFDEIEITPNGYMMIHCPSAEVDGDDEELSRNANLLKDLKAKMVAAYSRRSGKAPEVIADMLKRETWLNAEQAVAMGLANRITGSPVIGREFSTLNTMPHGVVTALFGAGSGGSKTDLPKEKSMSESKPVAATIGQLKAAFPKAKSDFLVRCMEKEMTMEQASAAHCVAMEEENQSLSAKVAAMETELEALRAKAVAMDTPPVEEEEVKPALAVARSGIAPVAKARGGLNVSARAKWSELLDGYTAKGLSKMQAAQRANREHPEVREAMVAEANS